MHRGLTLCLFNEAFSLTTAKRLLLGLAMLCRAMLRCGTLCCPVPCHAMLCYVNMPSMSAKLPCSELVCCMGKA